MDKAKAYDEALEKARQDRDAYQKELDKTDKNSQLANILRAGISAIEMIFPQLKESNDEKIRKDIIDHFESIKAQALYDNQEESDNIISSCNEKIAYLKKQKECLIDNTSEDEKMLRTIIQGFENWKGNGMERFNNTNIDDILVYLEKQKKPKVDIDKLRRDLYQSGYNDGYQHGKEDAQKEQKLDWNEEDEMMRENIISDLQYFRDCATDEEAVSDYNDEIAWLKDISLNHKKFTEAVHKLWSNEWNEEDEKAINDACCFLGEYAGYIGSKNWGKSSTLFSIVDKLKSLYPSWKPSKKQMDALKNITYGTYQNGDGPALRELYEQLDKLCKKNEKI